MVDRTDQGGAGVGRGDNQRRPRRLPVAIALVGLLIVAACGGDDVVVGEGRAETEVAPPSSAASPDATSSTAAEPTTSEPTTTPPPLTASGVAFASAITATGEAIDPGTTFPAEVNRLYAVFRADSLPPGLEVAVDAPADDGYYAYLRTTDASALSTFGWRWLYEGDLVVEYEAEAAASEFFWLERFDPAETGVFGGNVAATGLGPGRYTVEFTVSGNALFEESFTITG